MSSVFIAFRAFFAVLLNKEVAQRVQLALEGKEAEPRLTEQKTVAPAKLSTPEPARSEALTLLSTLQREARFLDLVQEPLDGFQDAQIGAAAREVLRDCKKTLDRMFGIGPLSDEAEGAECELEANPSPARYRLVGKSAGSSGSIAHRGWKATCCNVPSWNGSRNEAWILAPVEIDVT
jgi:hypothetical protein